MCSGLPFCLGVCRAGACPRRAGNGYAPGWSHPVGRGLPDAPPPAGRAHTQVRPYMPGGTCP